MAFMMPMLPWMMAKDVWKNAKDVEIKYDGVRNLASKVIQFIHQHYVNDTVDVISNKFIRYTNNLHPDYNDEKAADWLFVLYTLNFSLWYPKGAPQWTVDNFTGFYALSSAIKRAVMENIPIWNPHYYVQINLCQMEHIFRSDDDKTKIPYIEDRLKILHEIGRVLLDKYKGTFATCINLCNGIPFNLMNLLVDEFESYQDEAEYDKTKVCFNTKARILASEIWACNKCKQPESKIKSHINTILSTIFCDYRAPQVLIHFGVLCYSEKLLTRFKKNDLPLQHGSREEIEIRACSFYAVQLVCNDIVRSVKTEIPDIDTKKLNIPIAVANYLFSFRHVYDQELMEKTPLHKINTKQY